MPVNSGHPEYKKYAPQWEKCRCVLEGEEAVKEKGQIYLPLVSSKQKADSYASYKKRALFFNAVSRTAQALLGFLFRKPVILTPPRQNESFFDSLPVAADNFEIFIKGVSVEIINVGRTGIICDVFGDGTPRLAKYRAEDVINWQTAIEGGKAELSKVVLRENIEDFSEDEFEAKNIERYRALDLDENGLYRQRIFVKVKDEWQQIEEIQPTKNGSRLDFIPFVIINQNNILASVEKPTLIDLVNINLSHYRSSADLEQGRHYTAQPTPVVTGWDETSQLEIGANVAWVSDNTDADAKFLEFTGQGLTFLENALKEKENMMAVLGARLLEAQKKGVEAVDTYRIRNAGEQSILSNIAHTLDAGLTWICKVAAAWRGFGDFDRLGELEVNVNLNKDYVVTTADAALVTAMFAALQGGAISAETWFYNLKKWEMTPPGQTLDDEMALIEARTGLPEGR